MKKFVPLLILVCIASTIAFGQKEKNKKIPKHKTVLSIGLTASPDIYIYEFKANQDLTFDYKSEFNYSAGLAIVYYPVKWLSLRGSVLYSTKGFSVDYNYATAPPTLNPDSIAKKASLTADYLDLPIILHFNIIHKDRIQLFVAGGIVPGILVKKAQETLFTNNTERTTNDISKNFNDLLAGTIYSIGFKYNFSPKFGLGFDPYFRYYLNKIDKQAMADNPVSFGGKVSLYINFIHKHHRGNWFNKE